MATEKYTWTTEFDTANNLMIQTFSNHIILTVNIKTNKVVLTKDGEVVNNFHFEKEYTIGRYHQFIINVAIGAEQNGLTEQHKQPL